MRGDATVRIVAILEELRNRRGYVAVVDPAHKYGVSKRTISRDLDVIARVLRGAHLEHVNRGCKTTDRPDMPDDRAYVRIVSA